MAAAAGASSSSSSSSSSSTRKKYHVFISFRGEDTRETFTSDLYDALCAKKLIAYIDEETLKKGDEISSSLLEAIQDSEISVIVLSEYYASSRWCLDELHHILCCKETNNQMVVPIFYHVNPSDVRKQQGSFASSFSAHEVRFKHQMEKVQQWRNSLTTLANLSGFDSSNYRTDTKLLGAILKDIMRKLSPTSACNEFNNLVGIEERIQHVQPFLDIDSIDVRIVGFWGKGGIGKTTLARLIFSRFASQFEGCCFVNVKQESERYGLDNLKMKIFCEILLEENRSNMVSQLLKDRLRRTKVLLVLDNIDEAEQLKRLAIDRDLFGPGSKIIITTRDRQVLSYYETIDGTYMVEELSFSESMDLFCLEAFPQRLPPPVEYEGLSRRAVDYAKGIPLALTVLASHLRSKSTEQWESELNKLKKFPIKEVYDVLKISYDGLDSNEREIFLDIACFFNGEGEDSVKRILDAYGTRFMDSGLKVLFDKALITITSNKLIQMHDLLQEMGREIVRQESKEPGERSRLWSAEDIVKVLKHNTGTRSIEGISAYISDLKEVIRVKPGVFEKMYNLKYLKFFSSFGREKYLRFPESLDSFPDELRYLGWNSYPYKSLPTDFKATNLVELNLRGSELNDLWNGVQDLANLKALDLSWSKNLIQIPDLSLAVKLETLDLSYCECLNNLPSSIGKLESLQSLNVSWSEKINEFPELALNIRDLHMTGTSIKKVPSSIERLFHLHTLRLSCCKRLNSLPTTISNLISLQKLHLDDCPRLEYLPPQIISEHITDQFQIDGSGIGELPSSIENLGGFQSLLCLEQSGCSKLENLPPLFNLKLDGSNVSEIPDWFFRLPLLYDLDLSKTRIRTIPASIKSSKLKRLRITDCKSLESLPELPLSLTEVEASGCTSLKMVSNASIDTHLLSLSNANILIKFEEYPWTYRDYHTEKLQFIDCFKLDHNNILTQFQIRALRLNFLPGQKDLTFFKFTGKIGHCDLYICYPGDEIPKWFNCRNDNGSSLSMKLPSSQYCYDTTNCRGWGFASCLVVAPEVNGESNSYPLASSFMLVCVINVQSHLGERRIEYESSITMTTLRTNHVLMWYFRTSKIDLFSAREISFDFRIEKPDLPFASSEDQFADYKLERCGVRMLQPRDAVEFGIISSSGDFVRGESHVVTNEL